MSAVDDEERPNLQMREGMLWRYGKWKKDGGRGLKTRFCEDSLRAFGNENRD